MARALRARYDAPVTEREETRTVAQVVGRSMRRVRESRGKVLHDVASAARDLGLSWDASAVSRIETGRRDLTLEEFLALPDVLTLTLNEEVNFTDLLVLDREDEPLLSSFGRTTSMVWVMPMLAQPYVAIWEARSKVTARINAAVHDRLEEEKRRAQLSREPAEPSYEEFRAAAKELEVRPKDLMDAVQDLAAQGRWHERALVIHDERERRLLESGEDLSNPTRVRTLRGHITRQLMAELRDYFASREADRG